MAEIVGYVFNASDVAILKEVVSEYRNRKVVPRRSLQDQPDFSTTDVYVARTGAEGIPAISYGMLTGTGTGTDITDDRPGFADCEIYRKIGEGVDSSLISIPGLVRKVYNLNLGKVAPWIWITVKKDKSGTWWVDTPSALADVPGLPYQEWVTKADGIAAAWMGATANISSTTTVNSSYHLKLLVVNDTAGNIALNLDNTSAVGADFKFWLCKVGAGSNSHHVTVGPAGGDTIDGLAGGVALYDRGVLCCVRCTGPGAWVTDGFPASDVAGGSLSTRRQKVGGTKDFQADVRLHAGDLYLEGNGDWRRGIYFFHVVDSTVNVTHTPSDVSVESLNTSDPLSNAFGSITFNTNPLGGSNYSSTVRLRAYPGCGEFSVNSVTSNGVDPIVGATFSYISGFNQPIIYIAWTGANPFGGTPGTFNYTGQTVQEAGVTYICGWRVSGTLSISTSNVSGLGTAATHATTDFDAAGAASSALSAAEAYTDSAVAGMGSGTVISVDGSGGTTGLTLTGGPVTASGTLTLAGVLNVASGGLGGDFSGLAAGLLAADGAGGFTDATIGGGVF